MRFWLHVFRILSMALLTCGTTVTAAQAQVKADREFGLFLSSQCVTCHMISGKSVGSIPPIVGWPEAQFLAVMAAYKKKERPNPLMQVVAGRLSDEDTASLAAFFASIKPEK